jgi:hypothetical protein
MVASSHWFWGGLLASNILYNIMIHWKTKELLENCSFHLFFLVGHFKDFYFLVLSV